MSTNPTKEDIELIFNRLRSTSTNKTCFDCNAKNPTWASVTYGVFICIDCSAVHRSLGVHLTFVRSTNLDTNWTWIQLRQMQLGGNINALQFFRQHNCITTDAQQKYNSRAAQLYRDKLNSAAQRAMKVHGTTLLIDASITEQNDKDKKDIDFFATIDNNDENSFTNNNNNNNNNINISVSTTNKEDSLNKEISLKPEEQLITDSALFGGSPNVDFLNSTIPVAGDAPPRKSTIGVRKIQQKKSTTGAKSSGLGATKVKTNFADIEQKANLSDQQKFAMNQIKRLTEEEEAQTIASVRLAYQDLSLKQQKEEEKLKHIDPAKAKQMERLGMGFNVKGDVSHSAISDMKTLTQEPTPKISPAKQLYDRDLQNDNLFNDFDLYNNSSGNNNNSNNNNNSYSTKMDRDLILMGFETIEPIDMRQSNIITMFSPAKISDQQPSSTSSSSSNYGHNRNDSTGSNRMTSNYSNNNQKNSNKQSTSSSSGSNRGGGGTKQTYNTYETDDAQKKFGNVKHISSDQFFGKNQASADERAENLAKFQGSNSISSADYFGEPNNNATSSRGGGMHHYVTPDFDDVRESVRQSVSKVAGKFSSMANDVMTSLQDKYGV